MQFFGLPPNANAGSLVDADEDGFDNRFEYCAGLVPSDATSVFHWRLEPVPGNPAQRRIIFSPRLPDRTYTVQSSTSLLSDSWTSLSDATITDNGSERTVTDPAASGPRKFYRVDVAKP